MSKVLNDLAKKHPDKIESIERDDTGWIINLTDDWVETFDPLQPSHMIFEDTVAECLAAFRSIKPAGKQTTKTVSTVTDHDLFAVPVAFFNDHDSRECEPFCTPVKRTSRHVWLRLDDPGIDELLSDAKHYADPTWVMEPEYFGLKRSAIATVSAIEDARSSMKRPTE